MDFDKSEDRIRSIVGDIEWQHDFAVCECSWDAPDNEDAFMTIECAKRYYLGVQENLNRTRALLDWTRDVEREARVKAINNFAASMRRTLGL